MQTGKAGWRRTNGVPCDALICFDDFVFDSSALSLRRRGLPVKIQAKPLAVLGHLLEHRERTVSKRELKDAVWPRVTVSEGAIVSAVRDLRRALGERRGVPRTVITVRGRGFRFVAPVTSALTAMSVDVERERVELVATLTRWLNHCRAPEPSATLPAIQAWSAAQVENRERVTRCARLLLDYLTVV